jgi:hypothetical protein
MKIGMLWYDNDPKSDLAAKIDKAKSYYMKKYGSAPNVCFVHPSMVGGEIKPVGDVEVRTNGGVLPNHFWVGVESAVSAPVESDNKSEGN